MAERSDDLSIKQLFRVIFMQGGQVAIGTAIGAGVLLLVGIVAVFLAPIWLPIFAFWYWRREKRAQEAAAAAAAAGSAPDEPAEAEDAVLPAPHAPGVPPAA